MNFLGVEADELAVVLFRLRCLCLTFYMQFLFTSIEKPDVYLWIGSASLLPYPGHVFPFSSVSSLHGKLSVRLSPPEGARFSVAQPSLPLCLEGNTLFHSGIWGTC